MDKDKLIYSQYITIINSLSKITEADENLLTLFSEFISNNRDFKYNKTYLIDQIPEFKKCVEYFHNKKNKVQKFN